MLADTRFVSFLGIVCWLVLLAPLIGMGRSIIQSIREDGSQRFDRAGWVAFLIGSLFWSALLLRPHEDTFQGLDSSAYRLAAKALADGRPLKGIDGPFTDVPLEIRGTLLYRPEEVCRKTRDLSFQVEMDSCRTFPFHYPLLPLSMIGFDMMAPGNARDYLMPVVGLVFCLACLGFGVARSGYMGAVAASALILGSPLPVWFFRGCYPDVMGGILVAMSLLSWLIRKGESDMPASHFMALGLAVSFHPSLVVVAAPVLGIFLLCSKSALRNASVSLAGFALGLAPIALINHFITSPYGEFSFEVLVGSFTRNPSIRVVLVGLAVSCAAFLVVFAWRNPILKAASRGGIRWYLLSRALILLTWLLPTVLTIKFWSLGEKVLLGYREMMGGLRLPLALILGATQMYVLFGRGITKSRAVATVAFASLPVFLYLKGWDQAGMWSQRRLLPVLLVLIVGSLSGITDAISLVMRHKSFVKIKTIVVVLALGFAGLSNAVRWPAPYLVRFEKGADEWVSKALSNLGEGLVFFDYHPYSVPFAVSGDRHVFGLGEHGFNGLSDLSERVATRAWRKDVYWVTAYSNPGMEDEVVLEEVRRETVELPRLQSKAALPALKVAKIIDVGLLRTRSIAAGDSPAMRKVFDGGPLGLRPPWGRKDISLITPAGKRLPACWSREGSGIVGPLPSPGGTVSIRIIASACREDASDHQTLEFHPPWGGTPLRLVVSNSYTDVSGELSCPADQASDGTKTGVYRIYAKCPYNPQTAGISGFADDLGALIHSVSIETIAY